MEVTEPQSIGSRDSMMWYVYIIFYCWLLFLLTATSNSMPRRFRDEHVDINHYSVHSLALALPLHYLSAIKWKSFGWNYNEIIGEKEEKKTRRLKCIVRYYWRWMLVCHAVAEFGHECVHGAYIRSTHAQKEVKIACNNTQLYYLYYIIVYGFALNMKAFKTW